MSDVGDGHCEDGAVGPAAGVLGTAQDAAPIAGSQNSAHHVMGVFQLPWAVIGISMVLAVIATYFAAARPAKTIARIPVSVSSSGRRAGGGMRRTCG